MHLIILWELPESTRIAALFREVMSISLAPPAYMDLVFGSKGILKTCLHWK